MHSLLDLRGVPPNLRDLWQVSWQQYVQKWKVLIEKADKSTTVQANVLAVKEFKAYCLLQNLSQLEDM